MIEAGKPQANPSKMSSLSPKAIIHQKYGDKAFYQVEEVQVTPQNECPGLVITQKAPPCLYRCTLHLPETTVVSDTFKKKKEAEQSAAEKAIEKLGLRQKEYNPTKQEAWDDLAGRVAFLFANEFLSFPNPLSNHFRAALRRDGHFNGFVPVSVIAVYDAKTTSICKFINPAAEMNSLLVMSLVSRAAAKLSDLVIVSDDQLSVQRRNLYSPEIISSINHEASLLESIPLDVILIPVSCEKAVEPLKLNISATGYYLDVIAHALSLPGASDIIISRTIGKASSEMRIYSSTPKRLFENLSEPQTKQASHVEGSLNIRATYFAGQEIHGDAILASIGYTWKSPDLSHEAISLCSYYRNFVSKIPSGPYKVSRDAMLAAQLPLAFTTKSNWRGSFPRDILSAFCRYHHLSEPVFSTQSSMLDSSVNLPGSRKKLKATELSKKEKSELGIAAAPTGAISCNIKIYSKNQELLLECSPQESYRKQTDAVQSVALKVLRWLDIYFEKPDLSAEELGLLAKKFDIQFTQNFFKGFSLCHSVHRSGTTITQASDTTLNNVEGLNSGVTPANGCLACISYTVSLLGEGDGTKEYIESCEEFEFEVGNQAVLPHLEAAVEKMAVGQSAYFTVELPLSELILAASGDSAKTLSLLSPRSCKLEYCVTLLQVTEPLEDRMEQALFSPPLSKQRVEFAVCQIRQSSAVSLVDFGCGSGSLLDSLLSYPTSLEKIAGVDLSHRGLAKAAKLVHSKLNSLLDPNEPTSEMKSAALYYGNITEFDPQLHGFDIATCLEVIEHMEEEEACLFGNVVLSLFAPKILIVSTPNYEYNVILQGCTPRGQEDDPDEKNQGQATKFRNHDHKFEWTRAQFQHWASELAVKHNYSVEFSGVGGAADEEPGFASQIAIFRRGEESVSSMECGSEYVQIWKWSREDQPVGVS
ncbi:hypothetical protein SASPL_154082 [Salvia splendens]|uniref:Small RNA 2'-O-methyltransferase n=1 Tax=Salvia splendens TaxID=180675 RepID=A0A8X8VZH0_SALSN|nr:small RNA 2'-O-methyltransferase-like [Salvia splendens]XP_042042408.1 small RNA 2'-O-methyltransferase-like [Salvia splendens]XP_042042409.1 small RNA 2'-O-methyltransferase-like [Salvia splendens]XP_042042410.1 small RNA 2'-O-methyltransferase-like [Salvia splendens]KAG6385251.1 hypothetical protein SASPL_154082 [Salvia splendens]